MRCSFHKYSKQIYYLVREEACLFVVIYSGAKSQQCQVTSCLSRYDFGRKLNWGFVGLGIGVARIHICFLFVFEKPEIFLLAVSFSPRHPILLFLSKGSESFSLYVRQNYTEAYSDFLNTPLTSSHIDVIQQRLTQKSWCSPAVVCNSQFSYNTVLKFY